MKIVFITNHNRSDSKRKHARMVHPRNWLVRPDVASLGDIKVLVTNKIKAQNKIRVTNFEIFQ